MRFRSLCVLAVIALVGLCFISGPGTRAQSKAPAPASAPALPASVVQAANTINSTVPILQSGIQAIQQAQATGDPSAVVTATGGAISQATAAAAAVPSPASGYLALASIITAFATPLIAGIFGLFQHKANVAANTTAQSAHVTAQAAIAAGAAPRG